MFGCNESSSISKVLFGQFFQFSPVIKCWIVQITSLINIWKQKNLLTTKWQCLKSWGVFKWDNYNQNYILALNLSLEYKFIKIKFKKTITRILSKDFRFRAVSTMKCFSNTFFKRKRIIEIAVQTLSKMFLFEIFFSFVWIELLFKRD